jgi:hypothetical protein
MTAYDLVLIRQAAWGQCQCSAAKLAHGCREDQEVAARCHHTQWSRNISLIRKNRPCVQVMSTEMGRTLPCVVTGTLALVHTSGALEPLTFFNLNPSIQDLEYLASVITARIQRRQVTAGARSEHRVSKEGTDLLAETGTEDAIVIENELQPSALTDMSRRPGFVDTTPSGMSPPKQLDDQQVALLNRLSAWDADGYALLRTAPRLISHRVTARCDAKAQTVTVTIAPDGDLGDIELILKACLWYVAFVGMVGLPLVTGFFHACWAASREKYASETQKQERDFYSPSSITFLAPLLVLIFTAFLAGLAVLAAPRDVTLTVGTTAWKLKRQLKGFKPFPFLQSTSTGETNACCGCRVCALCLPSLNNLRADPKNHCFV